MRCKDLLSIDDRTYARITAELNAQSPRGRERDSPVCYNLETPMVALLNHADAGERAAYQVRPVDISEYELRFLHGRGEPANTPAVALLRDASGSLRMIAGRLGAARLVTGRIYLETMHFEDRVDPTEFVNLDGLDEEARRAVSIWHQNWKSLIKIDDKELFEVMEKIRTREDRECFRAKRRAPRLTYRQGAILVVLNPDDTGRWGAYRVPTMDLSATGLGFLHGMFVHPGTPCDILLATTDGRSSIVRGRVARCQIADGTVHQVGVRFDDPIEVERFVTADAEPKAA